MAPQTELHSAPRRIDCLLTHDDSCVRPAAVAIGAAVRRQKAVLFQVIHDGRCHVVWAVWSAVRLQVLQHDLGIGGRLVGVADSRETLNLPGSARTHSQLQSAHLHSQ